MTRQLWFDLRETLRQAETTIAGPTGEPGEPWLVVDTAAGRLWFTPVNAPRPRSATVTAVHDDGPRPSRPWPPYRQPLTEPGPDDTSLLDRLHAAAREGHRWLVIDPTTPPQLHTAAAYDTATVPATATWTPAYLAAGELGPYPGEIAAGYQYNGCVIARFRLEAVERIAADAHARTWPGQTADLLVRRGYGNRTEVFMAHAAGSIDAPTPGQPEVGNETLRMRRVTAVTDGWYVLVSDLCSWRQVDPPMVQTRHHRHAPEQDLFEPDGPHGSRCTVCGATGYDIADQALPSMAGYGSDTTTWCRICRSSESLLQEIGWVNRRAMWPPSMDAWTG
ncbi:hypothetical protein [Polymorphospora lycopeni]|uniref:Uncharacterized protein n=1 Tax=Polymorphospora lycopeni TaxID=3140240 RepID=A0ABV5CNH4_9ACTN